MDERILEDVTEEDRGIQSLIEFKNEETAKTLGLQWNPKTDTFTYKTQAIAESDEIPTKRKLLSTTAKIYDLPRYGWHQQLF